MKKIVVSVFAAFAIVAGLLTAGTSPAHAGWPGGQVTNVHGWSVTVQMNGGARYTEWEGMDSTLWGRDANQFRLNRDWRCVSVNSVWFKAKPGNFFKITDWDQVAVSAYTYKKCGTKKWISSRLPRA